MVISLTTVLQEVQRFVNKHDDDLVDRFNNRYTVIFLSIFMVLIASIQYIGNPIVCWTPSSFSGSHDQYANVICWTHGTYPVSTDQLYHTVDRSKVLPYYQWIPFLLLFQAACFMFPHLIWHTLSKSSSLDVTLLGENASKLRDFDVDNRNKIIQQIVRHMQIAFDLKIQYKTSNKISKKNNLNKIERLKINSRRENYLYLAYMFVKLSYIVNLVGQIVLMDVFFEFRSYSFGIDFLKKFLRGDDYSRIDKAFPRVTFCDFTIRNMGDNIHKINLFNEKFFIFLWFWLLFLALITVSNFISWMFILFRKNRQKTIFNYLKSSHNQLNETADLKLMNGFVESYCHLDGAFLFAIIRRNTNYMTTFEIINHLYAKYCLRVTELNRKIDHDNVDLNNLDLVDERTPVFDYHGQNNQENTLP